MNGLSPRALLTAATRHRGLLAGGLAAAAVAAGLGVLSPAPPDTVTVLSVGRDLPGGALLTGAGLRAGAPAGHRPGHRYGRPRRGPCRRPGRGHHRAGQRCGADRAAGPPATGGTSDRKPDVLVAGASLVAEDLVVLAVPRLTQDTGEGALLVVAAYPDTARRLAGAAVTHRLSTVVRPLEQSAPVDRG